MSNDQELPSKRLASLDGLRGVAAVVVLVHHATASIPQLGNVYFGEIAPQGLTWLVNSPLHLVWAGTEAVLVFFILSGVVLTLPSLRRGYDWWSYFPSRLLRLYMPVIASVALAVLIVLLVPRTGVAGRGEWMESHSMSPSLRQLFLDVTLLKPGWLNGPLWSLRWEVIFSILLPVYLLVAARLRKRSVLIISASVLISWAGTVLESSALTYLPIFFLGCALAPHLRDDSRKWNPRIWPWAFGAALIGITLPWTLRPILASSDKLVYPVVLVSAMIIVVASVRWAPVRRGLESRAIQYLGTMSFSLYLVHDPIIVAVATTFPGNAPWLAACVSLLLSLGTAAVFHKLVEAPSHTQAKRLARFIRQRRSSPRIEASRRRQQ